MSNSRCLAALFSLRIFLLVFFMHGGGMTLMLDLGTASGSAVFLPFMISTTDNIRLNERTYIFILFHTLPTSSLLFVQRTRDRVKPVRKLCSTLENSREHMYLDAR